MERLQGDKHFSELLLPISRFILKNSIFAQLFLNNIMRMCIIMRMSGLCDNIILHKPSLSVLLYKNVGIKMHLYW